MSSSEDEHMADQENPEYWQQTEVPVCQDLRGSQTGRAQTSGAEWISQNIHYLQPEIGSELSVENRAVLNITLAGYPVIMLG